jgi:hypothetical protein
MNEEIYWIKLASGDELISSGKITESGFHLKEPAVASSTDDQLIFAPFALGAQDNSILVPHTAVCWYAKATEESIHLYQISRKLYARSVAFFDRVLQDSALIVENATSDREPTDAELDDLEAGDWEETETKTIRSSIDNLIRLAEAAGKGNNGKKN